VDLQAQRRPRAGVRTSRTWHPSVACSLRLEDVRDYSTAVSRMRRLLDLDADPAAVAAVLEGDPFLGPTVAAAPGRRLPGTVAPFELAVRAVIGQQVSLASARRCGERVVARFGRPVPLPSLGPGADGGGPDFRLFAQPEDLARVDPADLPMPARRAATVVTLARAVASGHLVLDPGADRDEAERRLLELPGVGPWTAAYIRMRALGDPDVFLPGDLVLRRALAATGGHPLDATGWKPWRSYAVAHLWAASVASTGTGEGRSPIPPCTRPRPPTPDPKPLERRRLPMRTAPTPVTCWEELSLEFPQGTVELVLGSDGHALTGVRFGGADDHADWLAGAPRHHDDPAIIRATAQLRAYAAGRTEPFDVPMEPVGTQFQQAVWAALQTIPYGATRTYGAIAEAIGRPGQARAVGAAVGSNPIGIIIPCHRVIGSNGSLTGFGGGLVNKATLLAREGVTAL
jgi:O-6-methylguanine DNA methyltransferase